MTIEAPSQHQSHGVLAVLQALMVQLMTMLRGPGCRREMDRRLVCYETQLVLALFGGGLAVDPDYLASTPCEQLLWRRNLTREIESLRRLRGRLHRARTVRGRGYRRRSVRVIALYFERRIASRRTRRLGCARLAFVAATRETLAGAPP